MINGAGQDSEINFIDEYCVIVNLEEVYSCLSDYGMKNVILVENERDMEALTVKLGERKINIALLWYVEKEELDAIGSFALLDYMYELVNNLQGTSRAVGFMELSTWYLQDCNCKEDFIKNVHDNHEYILEEADFMGWILNTDYTGKCGNCHWPIGDNDRYCAYCGTRKGEGKFEPYYNRTLIIGLPVEYKWQCPRCNRIEKEVGVSTRYCRQCGVIMKILEYKRDW